MLRIRCSRLWPRARIERRCPRPCRQQIQSSTYWQRFRAAWKCRTPTRLGITVRDGRTAFGDSHTIALCRQRVGIGGQLMTGRSAPHLPSTQRFCSHSPLLITSLRTKRTRLGGASGSNSTHSGPAPGGSAASRRRNALNSASFSVILFHVIFPTRVTCTRLPFRKPMSGPGGMSPASSPSHPHNAIARNMRVIRIGIRYYDASLSAIEHVVGSTELPKMVAFCHSCSRHAGLDPASRFSSLT